LTGVALLALAGCGGEEFKLTSGTYALSQVSYVADGCYLKEEFDTHKEIVVVVTDTAITIEFESDETHPKGTIKDEAFTADASNDLDTLTGTTCKDQWSKKVTGTLTAESKFDGTYEFSDVLLDSQPGTCDASSYEFMNPKCTTTIKFTATKK
jgi:hypothetical protein